ncbi:MAG: NAD(P)/FAD-dependent oxidoreductase, partial [Thalassobaculaceae bacterium]
MKSLMNTADVIVVGGGLHGCSAALHLARRGVSVIVLEKDHVARHASGVNAGGVRRLGRDPAEVPISAAASEYWQNIEALVDDDCGYRQSRQIKVAENTDDLEAARRRVDVLRQQGFTHEEVIDRDRLRAFMPAVADHCLGALHVDGDGSAQPFKTTQAFRRRAETLGVRFAEGTPVEQVSRTSNGWRVSTPKGGVTGGALVNAAGAWGARIAAMLGEDIPLAARAPMLAITAPLPHFVAPVVGVMGDVLSLKQFENGTVLIGGGRQGVAYPDENRTTVDLAGIAKCLATARRIFPVLKDATVVRTWAGIEGYTPDNLPIIGLGQEPGVVHAFGFSAHGFQLGPAVGAIVADLVQHGQSALPIEAFRPDRVLHVEQLLQAG